MANTRVTTATTTTTTTTTTVLFKHNCRRPFHFLSTVTFRGKCQSGDSAGISSVKMIYWRCVTHMTFSPDSFTAIHILVITVSPKCLETKPKSSSEQEVQSFPLPPPLPAFLFHGQPLSLSLSLSLSHPPPLYLFLTSFMSLVCVCVYVCVCVCVCVSHSPGVFSLSQFPFKCLRLLLTGDFGCEGRLASHHMRSACLPDKERKKKLGRKN